MKLISHGLQGGKPWAKVEFALEDLERLNDFLFTARGGNWVGDLRRQMQAIADKMRQLTEPVPLPVPDDEGPSAAEAWGQVRQVEPAPRPMDQPVPSRAPAERPEQRRRRRR